MNGDLLGYEGDFLKEDVRLKQIYPLTLFGRTPSLHALRGKLPYKIRFFSPLTPFQELLGKRIFGVAFAYPKVFLYPHGGPRLTAVESRSGSDTTLW